MHIKITDQQSFAKARQKVKKYQIDWEKRDKGYIAGQNNIFSILDVEYAKISPKGSLIMNKDIILSEYIPFFIVFLQDRYSESEAKSE